MTDPTFPVLADLAGDWTLTDDSGSHSCRLTVPGDAISALHDAGVIADPYKGRNEYDCRWVAERVWTLRRTVTLDLTAVDLVIGGVDCVATVRVNGAVVLEAQNAFRSHRVDLSDVAVRGDNEIEITFHANPAEAVRRSAEQPFYIPYQAENGVIPHGNMLRKTQCDFGWDWNIALAPFGLYGPARLVAQQAPRIDRVAVSQTHREGHASVAVTADLAGAEGETYEITFAGQSVTGSVRGRSIAARFEIADPELWWPAGLGDQVLHDLAVTVGGVTETRRIGLRVIDLVSEEDAAGRSFLFRVNGHETYARGANWIPQDALMGRVNRAATLDLLQSAVDANMNMVRVWGGGRYEAGWFYDICDSLGIMVWQDFMFACHLYPSTPGFLAEVEAEVTEQVARLSHHACLACWCGDNELVGALTWFPESRENRDRYLVNYDRLNRTIEDALRRTDPAANWWPSSPSPGPLDFGDSWHQDGSGDMHFWSVWHEGRDFDHYRDVAPRFCSEFGFQSYPSMEVIRRFAEPADCNIASPVLESHQKNKGGNARIAETMFRYFRWPERFEDFVWLSQLQQALAIKTAVTHWRSLKPHNMGTLYWQLNDTWPVCSWSSLDHGGGWKLLHHFARAFYAPVACVAVPDGGALRLVGVNDGRAPVRIDVTAWATALDGTARRIGGGGGDVGGRAETLCALDLSDVGEAEVVTFGWQAADGARGGDIHAPRRWKAYDLPDPGLTCAVAADGSDRVLSVEAAAMAFFVTAEADVPGRFDRNAVHLGPGHTATLRFTPAHPGPPPRFTLRDLHSATMRHAT